MREALTTELEQEASYIEGKIKSPTNEQISWVGPYVDNLIMDLWSVKIKKLNINNLLKKTWSLIYVGTRHRFMLMNTMTIKKIINLCSQLSYFDALKLSTEGYLKKDNV